MQPAQTLTPADVLAFWRAAGPEKWFKKDVAFDAAIRERFAALHEAATSGALDGWSETAEGALALVIVLDQFSRNLFRGDRRTFAADPKALALADAAIKRGFDQQLSRTDRQFFYLPFMHSERIEDQERSVALYQALADPQLLPFAEDHADIIRRFGRFPHRNAVLGRDTTPQEQAFLDEGGFAG